MSLPFLSLEAVWFFWVDGGWWMVDADTFWVMADHSDSISPVSFCGGAEDTSISSPYACCGTPPEAADCCSSGDDPAGFYWYNASIVNFKLTPLAPLGSATSVSLGLISSGCGYLWAKPAHECVLLG